LGKTILPSESHSKRGCARRKEILPVRSQSCELTVPQQKTGFRRTIDGTLSYTLVWSSFDRYSRRGATPGSSGAGTGRVSMTRGPPGAIIGVR
jgi:hypothetical protein